MTGNGSGGYFNITNSSVTISSTLVKINLSTTNVLSASTHFGLWVGTSPSVAQPLFQIGANNAYAEIFLGGVGANTIGRDPRLGVAVGGLNLSGGCDISSGYLCYTVNQYDAVLSGYTNGIDFNATLSAGYNVIAGGSYNGMYSNPIGNVIVGGSHNGLLGNGYQTIVGGVSNAGNFCSDYDAIVGGSDNSAGAFFCDGRHGYTFVGGGNANTANDTGATVVAGSSNAATGQWSSVGGGKLNYASGVYSTIAGGFTNSSQGDYSIALGSGATSGGKGSLVFSDSSQAGFSRSVKDEVAFSAQGGFYVQSSSATFGPTGLLRSTFTRTGDLLIPFGVVSSTLGVGMTPVYTADINGSFRVSGQSIIGGTETVVGNAFSVGGSTFVVLASSVGIGKSAPAQALDVAGAIAATQILISSTPSTNNAFLTIGSSWAFTYASGELKPCLSVAQLKTMSPGNEGASATNHVCHRICSEMQEACSTGTLVNQWMNMTTNLGMQ